ncbi:syntaxin-12 [Diabrotica undecimpunctata]|uniref:syntaxin-12 n=1 Tax=Diabrotica undecimpunctata TaxID=50387 RepID=UPI003B6378DE
MNRQPPTYGAIAPSTQVVFSDQIATEFNNSSENVVTNIYTINKSIKVLGNALKVIGTKKDNQGIRNQVHVTQLSTNQIAASTSKEISNLKQLSKGHKQRLLQVEKLEENFKEAVGRYHALQKDVANKQKLHLLVPSESVEETAQDDNDENQMQAQKTRELAFEQDMLIERETRIRQIESDILDVNQIMRELGSLVHSQGATVDTIENSIDHAAGNIEEGTEQLVKASRYQNKYRKKLLYLVGIAVICATILIIVLVVELKKKDK